MANVTTSADIDAFMQSASNSSALVAIGAQDSATAVTLTGSQSITNKKLGSLTGNGFVKTSSGDGTLSVDTATYLTGNQTVTLSGDATGSGATAITVTASTPIKTGSIGITIDGGGLAITTGVKGYVSVPYACTINSVTMLADQSGSAVVDIWKDTYANYPPTVADTITASAKPTITATNKSTDATLTGWTTSVSAGDVIGFNVDSASTITRLQVQLKVTK